MMIKPERLGRSKDYLDKAVDAGIVGFPSWPVRKQWSLINEIAWWKMDPGNAQAGSHDRILSLMIASVTRTLWSVSTSEVLTLASYTFFLVFKGRF